MPGVGAKLLRRALGRAPQPHLALTASSPKGLGLSFPGRAGQAWVDAAMPARSPLLSQPAGLRPGPSLCFSSSSSHSPALGVGTAQALAFRPEQRLLLWTLRWFPHRPAPWNNRHVPGFSIALGELVEGLLGPKQGQGSLPLHFALKPTPSVIEKEGEET